MFIKPKRYLRAVRKPPFYALKLYPAGYGSLGGIKINYKTEVLDKGWDPIPGLYASGTDACDIYGDTYVFQLPGNTMGFAMTTGRMAAEHAAEYIKSRLALSRSERVLIRRRHHASSFFVRAEGFALNCPLPLWERAEKARASERFRG